MKAKMKVTKVYHKCDNCGKSINKLLDVYYSLFRFELCELCAENFNKFKTEYRFKTNEIYRTLTQKYDLETLLEIIKNRN